MAWTREDASHLLRRAGFGGSIAEVEALYAMGRTGAMESLLGFDNVVDTPWDLPNPLGLDAPLTDPSDATLTALYRLLASRRPLQTRLTWFWHGHFAAALNAAGAPATPLQLDTWRLNAAGRFRDFLPAMYRNGLILRMLHNPHAVRLQPREMREVSHAAPSLQASHAAAPARIGMHGGTRAPSEVLEGVGAGAVVRAGPASPDEVMQSLIDRPETMLSVCSKLYRHFVHEYVQPMDLQLLLEAWRRSGGSIRSVLNVLFRGNTFWDKGVRGTLMKGALEFVAGLVQRFELTLDRPLLQGIALSLPKLGPFPLEFRNPTMRHTALQLSSADMMLARYEFARYAVFGVDPGRVAQSMTAGFPRRTPPNVFITLLSQRLGIAALSASTRNVINEFLGNKARAGEVNGDKVLGAVYLLACSPEYQSR